MAKYLGYISLNTENIPANVSTATHVRVRIPQFHNYPDNVEHQAFVPDNQLPFARVTRPIDNNTFNAIDYFEEGTVVLVELLNNDLNNLLIGGILGNYTYTNDSAEIERRKNDLANSSGNYNSQANLLHEILPTAKRELYSITGLTDGGKSIIKYNDWYSGVEEGSGNGTPQDWSTVFVCWVFHKSGCADYFNQGSLSSNASAVLNTHKTTKELVDGGVKNAQAGDLIFLSLSTDKNPSKIEIAIGSYDTATKAIPCIGGNIQLSDTDKVGVVKETTRSESDIVAVVRPGSAICTNRSDPKWKQTDSQWSNDLLPGGSTIGQIGCIMTSVAILLRMTGLTKQGFNPGVFNSWLKQNGGYTSGGLFSWTACNNYVNGWQYSGVEVNLRNLTNAQKYNKIKSLIDSGYYVVVRVGKNGVSKHSVAITGYTADDIIKSDPYVTSTSLLHCNTYNSVFHARYYTCSVPFKCD